MDRFSPARVAARTLGRHRARATGGPRASMRAGASVAATSDEQQLRDGVWTVGREPHRTMPADTNPPILRRPGGAPNLSNEPT